jgi:hypothetical protein
MKQGETRPKELDRDAGRRLGTTSADTFSSCPASIRACISIFIRSRRMLRSSGVSRFTSALRSRCGVGRLRFFRCEILRPFFRMYCWTTILSLSFSLLIHSAEYIRGQGMLLGGLEGFPRIIGFGVSFPFD